MFGKIQYASELREIFKKIPGNFNEDSEECSKKNCGEFNWVEIKRLQSGHFFGDFGMGPTQIFMFNRFG